MLTGWNRKAFVFYLVAPVAIIFVSLFNNWRYKESYTVQGKKRWLRALFGYGVWGTLLFGYAYCTLIDAFSISENLDIEDIPARKDQIFLHNGDMENR